MAAPIKYLEFKKIEPKINPETDVKEPDPRSGHRIVVDEGNLYSIGGYNPDFWETQNNEETYYPLFKELWQFNFASRKWIKLKPSGRMPVELASHSAMLHGQNLLVFGGTGVPFGDAASDQLHVCNLKHLEWKHIQCMGSFPIRCYGHTMMLLGDFMYIYGGTTGWEYNSELHRLNLETRVWEEVETTGETPEGRYRHEVALDANRFFVFGGGRATKVYAFDQISVYNFEKKHWGTCACVADKAYGFPTPRRCHSCVQSGQSVYMCGGYNGESIYDDLWQLDLGSYRWTRLPASLPVPLYFHASAITPSGCMYIFGGVTKLDVERTSDVVTIWLKVPSLRELCWHYVSQLIPDTDTVSKAKLMEIGIPIGLIDRMA